MSYCVKCGKWNGAIAAPAGLEPFWCVCSTAGQIRFDSSSSYTRYLEREIVELRKQLKESEDDNDVQQRMIIALHEQWHKLATVLDPNAEIGAQAAAEALVLERNKYRLILDRIITNINDV